MTGGAPGDPGLTHVAPSGAAKMVDVSPKPETDRVAVAEGEIRMQPETLAAIRSNEMKKGDVIAVARVAGIMAAKRTAELIPLCHPIPLHDVQIAEEFLDGLPGIRVRATVRTIGRTGVEMEALSAVTVALLTIYDMAKAMDRSMELGRIVLIEKTGGLHGDYARA
jgi:cyclic pyranopterin monophosphate synthase